MHQIKGLLNLTYCRHLQLAMMQRMQAAAAASAASPNFSLHPFGAPPQVRKLFPI